MIRARFLSLRGALRRRRTLLIVTLLAFVVRLVWNLAVHNPLDFAYSDMGGYLGRGDQMITRPWLPPAGTPPPGPGLAAHADWIAAYLFGPRTAHLTLYPYGTHALFGAVKALFGRDNHVAIPITLAALGALAVGFTYATAERFTARRAQRAAIAAILITYYPWISLGGYALSETPFTACLTALAFYAVRLADEGRPGDAWRLGLWCALGALVRPQVLLSVAALGLVFLLRRRVFRRPAASHLARAGVPLAIALALSTWRVHWHLGHPVDGDHLISTNGPLNRVFGRCHNIGLASVAHDAKGFFGPPSLGSLRAWEKAGHPAIVSLDPAFGEQLSFNGHMWDAEPANQLAARCVARTGRWRQIKYAITHVVLLWGYNVVWPDMGNKARYSVPMNIWCAAHTAIIMPPAVVAMFLAFRRRRARLLLLSAHVWALVVASILYFGDTRYRTPYDGLLTILAIPMLAALWHRARAYLEARHTT